MRKETDYEITEYSVYAGKLTFEEFTKLWRRHMGEHEELVDRHACSLDCFVVKWKAPSTTDTQHFKEEFETSIEIFENKVKELCELKKKLTCLGLFPEMIE